MTSFEIRKKFLDFFENKEHVIAPSSSLIPQKDPSLLFVNAGMNQFKNIFLGLEKPQHKQVISIQKCLRAGGKHNDIETVGKSTKHHTFFEMMGNFSFGSYFKKEAIAMAWEFLVKELGFQEDHLWVSVFQDDDESYDIWKNQQHVPEHRILKMSAKDNFWQMGNVGPCGPCSEIHYYNGDKKNPDPDEDLIEIWNLVFMQFYDDEQGKRNKLPQPCVDTGMGLERLTSLIQNKQSNYHTDLFKDIISDLEKQSLKSYNFTQFQQDEVQVAFRVLADHARATSFLMSDHVLPGSDGSSYVLRRIMRRAFYYSQKLHPQKNLLKSATEKNIEIMQDVYPDLKVEASNIIKNIEEEFERFHQNLETGRKKLSEKIKALKDPKIDFEMAWDLYNTYGFPVDLTRLIAKEKNYEMIDKISFEKEKSLLEKTLKGNHKIKTSELENLLKILTTKHLEKETVFTGYQKLEDKAQLLYLFKKEGGSYQEVSQIKNLEEGWIVTNKTCFYPEGGGPIGDQGLLKTQLAKARVLDCLKKNNMIFHKIKMLEGALTQGDDCSLLVDKNFRQQIATAHTGTHLLHASLKKVLGSSVRQAGSLVEPGYLRFDFSHSKALSRQELDLIEKEVCKNLEKQEELSSEVLPFEKAVQQGALFLKGESYTKEVRVITIGTDSSKELCGGIHVKNTKDIAPFVIISETGVQSGVRRITALTSEVASQWLKHLKKQSLELAEHLQIDLSQEKQNPFLKWEQNINKEIKILKRKILKRKMNPPTSASVKSDNKTLANFSQRDKLVHYNLQLREHLCFSIQKEIETNNPLLVWSKKKQAERNQLKAQSQQMESIVMDKDSLLKQAKNFQAGNIEAQLIMVQLPLEDRKLLADTADQIKSKLSSGVVIAVATRAESKPYPIIVSVSKNLQKNLQAGRLLKEQISPILKGKGGGAAHFAQGSVTDLSQWNLLEESLLKHFKSLEY